jgi:hypothetical protein
MSDADKTVSDNLSGHPLTYGAHRQALNLADLERKGAGARVFVEITGEAPINARRIAGISFGALTKERPTDEDGVPLPITERAEIFVRDLGKLVANVQSQEDRINRAQAVA